MAHESLRKCKSPKEFFAVLEQKGVRTEQVKNKQGKVYGLRFEYKCEVFKASEIGREFGLHSLYNHFGIKLDEQKGEPFIPQHRNESSVIADFGKAALSVGGIMSGAIDGLATVAGAIGDISDAPYSDDIGETVADAEERRRRKKAKLNAAKGKGRGKGMYYAFSFWHGASPSPHLRKDVAVKPYRKGRCRFAVASGKPCLYGFYCIVLVATM